MSDEYRAEMARRMAKYGRSLKDQDQGSKPNHAEDQSTDEGLRYEGIKGFPFRDVMDFVNNHPSTVYASEKWNIYPQALTNAVKNSHASVVLAAIKETRRYEKAIKNTPAGFFWKKWREFKATAEHSAPIYSYSS